MRSSHNTSWKRWLLAVLAIISLSLAVALGYVGLSSSMPGHLLLATLLVASGVYSVYIAVRGTTEQVDKAVDSLDC